MGQRTWAFTLTFFLLFAGLAGYSGVTMPASATDQTTWPPNHIVISEVLSSASSADYNGTDWNGDGDIGNPSDQFIELWNPTSTDVDISDWWLDDDPLGGSAQCSIGWNTTLAAGERIAFFRDDTDISLDYWDGDSVQLRMTDGTVVDSISYPPEDSWWDRPYVRNASDNGSLWKGDTPTPGWAEGEDRPATQADWGRCYTPRDHIHEGSYVLTGRVVTMTGVDNVIPNGSILVTDGEIEAVWETGDVPLGVNLSGVPTHHTGASIYPGLIDMHQHLTYNVAPLWDLDVHLSESSRNEWGGYQNRYQWTNHPDYGSEVSKVKISIHSQPYWNMESEAMKYVEMKEVVGGTTSIQGDGHNYGEDTYDSILARNIEHYNWGRDEVETKILQLDSDYSGNHIKSGNSSGELDAWFLHLAEGVDQSSLDEFDIIENNDLVVGELVLIHGTGLTAVEFQKMADVGASLVWSPTSNLLLYGQTTDVAAAKQAGVMISLAPDWSPSGTKSPLHELKTADIWDEHVLGDIFSNYEMVQMVTSNAADSMNWGGKIGRIQPGLAADFVVVDSFDEDPYRNLIEAVDPDVRLTIMGGIALFGDVDMMQALKGQDYETVQIAGIYDKALDVTYSGIEEGTQTWQSIVENLSMAMRFDREEMWAHYGDSFDNRSDFDEMWVEGSYGAIDAIPLDPIFTWGDERYFGILNGSVTANAQVDMSLLYDNFYSVEMDSNGNRLIQLDWPQGTQYNGTPITGGGDGGNGEGGNGEGGTGEGGNGEGGTGEGGGNEWKNQSCEPGETHLPDETSCSHCVCLESGTWLCDESGCETTTEGAGSAEDEKKFSGMMWGIITAVILLSALLYLSRQNNDESLNPWDEEAVFSKTSATAEVEATLLEEESLKGPPVSVPDLPPMGPPPDSEE